MNKAYLSAVTVTKTFLRVFTYDMAAKINGPIDMEQNYATVTLCISRIVCYATQ